MDMQSSCPEPTLSFERHAERLNRNVRASKSISKQVRKMHKQISKHLGDPEDSRGIYRPIDWSFWRHLAAYSSAERFLRCRTFDSASHGHHFSQAGRGDARGPRLQRHFCHLCGAESPNWARSELLSTKPAQACD